MVISKDTKFWRKAKGDRCKVVAGCLLLVVCQSWRQFLIGASHAGAMPITIGM